MKKIIISALIGSVTLAIVTVALFLWAPWRGKVVSFPQKGPVAGGSEMIGDFRGRGEALYKKRHYQTLAAVYEKVLTAAPGNVDTKKRLAGIYFELGKIERELGDEAGATRDTRRALDLDPDLK